MPTPRGPFSRNSLLAPTRISSRCSAAFCFETFMRLSLLLAMNLTEDLLGRQSYMMNIMIDIIIEPNGLCVAIRPLPHFLNGAVARRLSSRLNGESKCQCKCAFDCWPRV